MLREECDRVIEKLGIDIDLFLEHLDTLRYLGNKLEDVDRRIICASLCGKDREEIAHILNRRPQYVGDRLSIYIYPKIYRLMLVNNDRRHNNWLVILNWLLDPDREYRLNKSPRLNADNFQASFGSQVFLYPHALDIGNAQIAGGRYYQTSLWYVAQRCFIEAWKAGKELFHSGSPEIAIYINNCAIEQYHWRCKKQDVERKISTCTIAVVVPIHHDRGQIAAETLQGIAQIQLQINAQIQELSLDRFYTDVSPLQSLPIIHHKIAVKILIVNDINNLYDGNDRTAESLTKLALRLNLIAVIGHYSSEATRRALPVYAKAGIVLVNSSSSSDKLSSLGIGEQLSFFRIPPSDRINAASLIQFLSVPSNFPHSPPLKKVAIIYAENSIYSNSYRQAIEHELSERTNAFQLLSIFGYVTEEDIRSANYIAEIERQGVDIVIMIIDARIDPNFLANTGILNELDLDRCILAGSATLYKQNFSRLTAFPGASTVETRQPQIVSCLPWHWDSPLNGCNSSHPPAQDFCTLANRLWDVRKVTWRSATAFDSMLLIYQMLQRFPQISDSRSFLEEIDRYFKIEQNEFEGITGKSKFTPNGDRQNPPTEIVKLEWDESQHQWLWKCVSPT
jgi:branched-chain amino acid transport system substrate-binding protein